MTKPVIGILGLGSLGEGLARAFAGNGAEVIGVDRDANVVARVGGRLGHPLLALGNDPADLKPADIVIEAVPEDRMTKEAVLGRLVQRCAPDTVLLTTASTFSVPELAIASGAPDRVAGLRFSLPPPEAHTAIVVETAMAQGRTIELARRAAQLAGTEPVALAGRPFEVATALVYAWMNRTVALAAEGYAGVEEIDTAMRLGCGLGRGPFELLDLIGLDTVRNALTVLGVPPAGLLERMVTEGRLGRKTGHGFHRYDGAGARVPADRVTSVTGTPREITRAGVVGSGTMARGIAEVLAVAGIPTTLVARTVDKAEAARDAVAGSLARSVRKGRITEEDRLGILARLTAGAGYTGLADCDVVVEAVAEDMSVKSGVLRAVDAHLRPGAVIATTTSSLSVTDCAEHTGRPRDVIGLHFFNPAPVMRLVEVVSTRHTDPDVHATAHALVARLRKTAVDCADRTGFIVNFLLFPYLDDAVRLLARTDVTVAEVDTAVTTAYPFPMGPFTLLDTIGLDVSLAIMDMLTPFQGAPAEPLRQLVAAGHLGRKNRRGFRMAGQME
ncbi:3-hydroxyacyl-CoA dehydrogenase family protein [Streptomyces pacificus]|uniref:3-hydroxyacyl-CoA dehydrogenase family protein n=1 Tax=Streptomyces pacificus TaxID=2705029 RepID=A0A6A0B292_9ACTN|nr:3-hydroxyacyl-CoA dehydrogenase family protein [Streptomyces pacificus]GFH39420.1 3-hydroxyacyl-CoA dehydrogenase family protein [Streptomyces pacificus]